MTTNSILVLTGGVGGAKLCLGLQRILPPGRLIALVNTGDDFEHLGLHISPDLDTTLYTLGGLANQELGWGRANESWSFMKALAKLGGETWFRLGDADLAIHVERTRRLSAGENLTSIIADFALRFEIPTQILPMSDCRVSTLVDSNEGTLSFQEYFVRRGCAPAVNRLTYQFEEGLRVSDGAASVLKCTTLDAVIIAPSNPYLSIAPILAVPGIREALRSTQAPVVAVTPIIAGRAVKGPTAKIMHELGTIPSPIAIAEYYSDIIDGFVLDIEDSNLAAAMPVPTIACNTLMLNQEDRDRVAKAALQLARTLNRR